MAIVTDPMRDVGRWLVTTASGAQHLIDATDPDRAVTVTRVITSDAQSDVRFWLQPLRRDEHAVRVIAVEHSSNGEMHDGIIVGEDMFLTLEPLDPAAAVTIRRTTPVVSVEPAPSGEPGRDE